jgi:predicted RNase H-like nuclease (RuvC/YqgF family)
MVKQENKDEFEKGKEVGALETSVKNLEKTCTDIWSEINKMRDSFATLRFVNILIEAGVASAVAAIMSIVIASVSKSGIPQ